MSENIESSGSDSMREYMPKDDQTEVTEDTQTDDGGEQTPTETPEVESQKETPDTPSGDTPDDTGSEETFAENFDPKSLSPELQQAYKQMQGDYTRKTQEIARERANAENYKKYSGIINYLGNNPDAAQRFIEMVQQKPSEQGADSEDIEVPDDPVEFAKFVKEQAKKEAWEDFMKYEKEKDQQTRYVQYVNNQAEEASKLDERLQTDTDFAQIIGDMVLNDPAVQQGQKTIVDATKQAIERYDRHFKARLESEKKKLSEQAKNKRSPSAPQARAETKAPTKEISNMRDAYEAAFGK